ncbi:MAG: tetratricopeptide repeat protein [bacterium]
MKKLNYFLFMIVMIFGILRGFIFGENVEIKAQLLSPEDDTLITRHPQVVIKYSSDVSPIIKVDSLRFLVNNIDYTNYIRIDISTPELIVAFYATKPFNIGRNVVTLKGKLINDDTFENNFVINVNPRLSKEVAALLDAFNKTDSPTQKSEYLYNLGRYYEKKGYFLDALGYYEQALSFNKNNSQARSSYQRILSLLPGKAKKIMNIALDVTFVNIDVLNRNGLYLFRCVVENYRDDEIEFTLDNFLLSSKSSYYQPIKKPYDHIRKMVQRNLMTIDDFAISNYLLSKDSYYLEYPDKFVVGAYSQLRVDLMFGCKEKDVIFQFFKPSDKSRKSQKEIPVYFRIPFTLP